MQPLISQALVSTRIAEMRREAEVMRLAHAQRRPRRQRRRLVRAVVAAATNGARTVRHA